MGIPTHPIQSPGDPPDPESGTTEWYQRYYTKKGLLRNDLLRNREVLFQNLAVDESVIRALGSIEIDPGKAKVLDVGCGTGKSLLNFLRLGFDARNLHGIDIQEDRILEARSLLPNVDFRCGDASASFFEEGAFDVVFESTMFVQITSEELAGKIAKEMIRVTRKGGFLVLSDWRYSKPGNKEYKGLSLSRLRELFQVGLSTNLLGRFRGALIPPIGRLLSKRAAFLYFPLRTFLPFLAGHQVHILNKR